MTDPLRVIVLDDHPLFAQGLQLLLNARGGRLEIIEYCTRAEMALDLVRRVRPHIALVDINMPPPGGIEAMRVIKRAHPDIRVVALSGVSDDASPVQALRAGADGFLPKTSEPDALIPPLEAIAAGWAVLPSTLLTALLEASERLHSDLLDGLDEDQVHLWRLLASGESTEDVAATLAMSERTVKRQVASLLRRLGVSNRVAAAGLAGRVGLLDTTELR